MIRRTAIWSGALIGNGVLLDVRRKDKKSGGGQGAPLAASPGPLLKRGKAEIVQPPAIRFGNDSKANANNVGADVTNKGLSDASGAALNYRNVYTYPPHSPAAEEELIQHLLKADKNAGKTRDKIAKSISTFLSDWKDEDNEGMRANFYKVERILPDGLTMDQRRAADYLNRMLNNKGHAPSMLLVDRSDHISEMRDLVMTGVGSASCDKSTLGTLFSTRGSGKTQLLKYSLYTAAAPAVSSGQVLVCDCGASTEVKAFSTAEDYSAGAIAKFLISLIRKHLSDFGRTLSLATTTTTTTTTAAVANTSEMPATLAEFATAKAEVARAFAVWRDALNISDSQKPYIVLDTSEALPHGFTEVTNDIYRKPKRKYKTILEALISLVPSGHCILAAGALLSDTTEAKDGTLTVARNLDPLRTLTLKGFYDASVSSWGVSACGVDILKEHEGPTISMAVVHLLCGGVPRLLQCGSQAVPETSYVTFLESWGRVIGGCMTWAAQRIMYESLLGPLPTEEDKKVVVAMSLLVSGTLSRVDSNEAVPFTGGKVLWKSVKQAVLYTMPHGREAIPPAIALGAKEFVDVTKELKSGDGALCRRLMWPSGLDLGLLHAPAPLEELRVLGMKDRPTARGRPFEAMSLHAMVARYHWLRLSKHDGESSSSSAPRLSLLDIADWFEQPRRFRAGLEELMVDFSGGIVELEKDDTPLTMRDNVLYHITAHSGHHDARFVATTKGGKRRIVCVQIRHGKNKTVADLEPQTKLGKGVYDGRVDVLLVLESGPTRLTKKEIAGLGGVDCVFIDGSKIVNKDLAFLYDPLNMPMPAA